MPVVEKPFKAFPANCSLQHAGKITIRGSNLNKRSRVKTVWIDLENSPHVPFFKPIIEELERRGYCVELTARDCFQVCALADMFRLKYRPVGHHYGKNKLAKVFGLGIRSLQMLPYILKTKPDLAVSHGSRSQCTLAKVLRIPSIVMTDYEHSHWSRFVAPPWVMVPDIIPEGSVLTRGTNQTRILRYPGIKEDVYVPFFSPDPLLKNRLALKDDAIVITVRPPANEAHYHNPESERLLQALFELIANSTNIKAFLLPRTAAQEVDLKKQWPTVFQEGKVEVPANVVNGLDLIWISDLVVSGGGTMNREAAALGVPVYSIFRGKIGAVDQYLAQTGRLKLLQTPDDVRTKIALVHRTKGSQIQQHGRSALDVVVEHIISILESN